MTEPDDTTAKTAESATDMRSEMRVNNFDQLMPVVLFLVFYNLVNTEWAVITATAWSIKAAYSRKRRGLPVGAWLPLITSYLIVRAAVTIAVEREKVDFGTKILIGIAIAATIVVGRPLLVWLIPKLVRLDLEVTSDRRYVRALTNVSWMAAGYEIVSAVWDIWLFNNSGVSVFLLTRQVVNFVVAFVLITLALMYIDRKLEPIEAYPGLVHVLSDSGRIGAD